MRLAVFGESPADEAAIPILTDELPSIIAQVVGDVLGSAVLYVFASGQSGFSNDASQARCVGSSACAKETVGWEDPL
jgi:hypothetical protein